MKYFLKPFLIFLFFTSCSSKHDKAKPVFESITESVYASGIVKSVDQYQVFPTVSGMIKEITVVEGQLVKKGDAIIRIENEAARLNTENAKLTAEFNAVLANKDKLDELKISIDLAKSKKENDSLLYERQKNLWAQKIGSQVELEQRKLAFENSTTTFLGAQLRYDELKRQLDFSSKQSSRNYQISSTISGDYTIKSEIDGKVYSILKEKGETVNPQFPVALIGDANYFILELQIDEYDISKIKLGQEILINMDSYKNEVFSAKVSKVNPILNERTKSFSIEGIFITQPPVLYPNLTVEANIVIQTKKNILTIPRDFLINDSMVLLENKETKVVKTGLKDYKKVEITKGLSEGEIILKPLQ